MTKVTIHKLWISNLQNFNRKTFQKILMMATKTSPTLPAALTPTKTNLTQKRSSSRDYKISN